MEINRIYKALWFALDIDVANMVAWLESIGLALAIITTPIGFFMLLGFTLCDAVGLVGLAMGIVAILGFIVMGALTVVRYIKRVMLWYRSLL